MENLRKRNCGSTVDVGPVCQQLKHNTYSRILTIEQFTSVIQINDFEVNQSYYSKLCESGCRNYCKKYSCPPFSPSFSDFLGTSLVVQVLCYRLDLSQFAPIAVYSRIRAGNSVLKSLIDKKLTAFKAQGFKVAGSGSCRACKICGAKLNVPCKKPDRRIYSLEALGVDVNSLVLDAFGFPLQWYLKGRDIPDYTCTVGAVFS